MNRETVVDLIDKHIEKDSAQFAEQRNWEKYRYERQIRLPSSIKKLDDCEVPIVFELLNEVKLNRIRYNLSCSQSTKNQKWSVKINVNMSYYVPVASLLLPLPRGHVLEAEDLIYREQQIRRNSHYYFNISALTGKKLRRHLRKNSMLEEKDIEKEEPVSRGREVIIVLEHKALTLSLIGIPLKSGELGDLIKVRNKQSGNIITATVIGKNKVSVRIY